MKKIKPLFLLTIFLLAAAGVSAEGDPIQDLRLSSDKVLQYQRITVTFRASPPPGLYATDTKAEADISVTGPDQKTLELPAFYNATTARWEARFTPTKTGYFKCNASIRIGGNIYRSKALPFECFRSEKNGFIRKSTKNSYYLVYDDGKPFFGIGHNVAWTTNNSLNVYERYFSLLKENRCNLARVWLNTLWSLQIEGPKIGMYSMADSEKLDALLQLAEKYGIYIVLVFDSYSSLMSEKGAWSEESWNANPYNMANGGPCASPEDFFTNEPAKSYYKDRLRYMVARWSFSPQILAFELWNEMDAPPDWVSEMSRYVDSINPHKQLITTSMGYPWGNNFDESGIYPIDTLGIIDRHLYANQTYDVIGNLIGVNRELIKQFKKPLLVGEFGMNANRSDAELDRNGTGMVLHDSIWASALSGSCAGALNWWWDEYIRTRNLYPHYKALALFLNDVRWDAATVMPINAPIQYEAPPVPSTYSTVTVKTSKEWGQTSFKNFSIQNNGDVDGGLVNGYLQGELKKSSKVEPVFSVNYPTEGKFIIDVGTVSSGAYLVVEIDGVKVLEKDFPVGPGTGPWKRCLYRPDKQIYQCVYDTKVEIDVTPGPHSIRLSNSGKDWMEIKKITMTNYMSSRFAYVRMAGLRLDDEYLFWIKNKMYDPENYKKVTSPSSIRGTFFMLNEIPDGEYDVHWYDTFTGKILKNEKKRAKQSNMLIRIPDFENDIACRMRKRVF